MSIEKITGSDSVKALPASEFIENKSVPFFLTHLLHISGEFNP